MPLEACDAQDLRLVERARSGEEAAVKEFGERLELVRRVLRVRNARMGRPFNEVDLGDIVQDVGVIVWRKLDTFEGRSSLDSWIYRISIFEFLNALRRRSARARDVNADEVDPPGRPSPAEGVGVRQDLWRALDRLDEMPARTVRMKHYEGCTFVEIGRALDISTSAAKMHYYTGLQRLRELLATSYGGGDGH